MVSLFILNNLGVISTPTMQLLHYIDIFPTARLGGVVFMRLLARLSHISWIVLAGLLAANSLPPEAITSKNDLIHAMLITGIVTVLVFQIMGLYGDMMFNRKLKFALITKACVFSFSILFFSKSIVPAFAELGYKQLFLWFFFTLLLLWFQRICVHAFLSQMVQKGVGLQNMVILGKTESGERLAEYFKNNVDIVTRLIGYVEDRVETRESAMGGLPNLGTVDDLLALIRANEVQQVMIALPWTESERMETLIKTLRQFPINLLLAPDMSAFHFAHNRVSQVAGLTMFNISNIPLQGWAPVVKRVEDLVLSSLFIILFSPLMLLLAVLIKLDSPGPVIFRQKRYGYNNQMIEVFKFRSMRVEMTDPNAEKQTTRDDPRVTKIGRLIRKTSMDELPQLFNVFLGNMSIVGPRPHAIETKAAGVLFEEAVDEYAARHRVKPGMTGWAQVNGYRGETDTLEKLEKRIAYDLEYIENWSLWYDIFILFKTIPAVFGARAAY